MAMASTGPLVLVIEETASDRATHETLLMSRGYRVLAVSNDEEALAAIATNRLDLILLDCQIVETGELRILHEIRRRNKAIPLIMITTEDSFETVKTAAKEGVSAYLVKPVDPESLFARVAEVLAKGKIPSRETRR